MKLDVLTRLNRARALRRPMILVTDLQNHAQRLVDFDGLQDDPLADLLTPKARSGQSGLIEREGARYFVNVHAPSPRLLAIGAVHIAQALAPMAKTIDFDVTIIDPREAFADPARFPHARTIADWPDSAIPKIGLDGYTALAALTHDPKIDDPALEMALTASCFYIGALGSRKTHARRLERLRAKGFSEAQLERIRAPIGLDIGAVSPAEIAASILGELILSLRKKQLRIQRSA